MAKFEAVNLELVQLILNEIRSRQEKDFIKATKLLGKAIHIDFRVYINRFAKMVIPGTGPILNLDLTNFLAYWLKGPFTMTVFESFKFLGDQLAKSNPLISTTVVEDGVKPTLHEQWIEGDRLLGKERVAFMEHMTVMSYGPDKLLRGVYPMTPGLPVKRIESKSSKVRS